jgi:predicted nucleotidyltransferase
MASLEIERFFLEKREDYCRYQKKVAVVEELERILKKDFPGCKIIPFGSTSSGLALKESDLDVLMVRKSVSLTSQFQSNRPPRSYQVLKQGIKPRNMEF